MNLFGFNEHSVDIFFEGKACLKVNSDEEEKKIFINLDLSFLPPSNSGIYSITHCFLIGLAFFEAI